MSRYYLRASRTRSSCLKEFQFLVYQNDGEYPVWCTLRRTLESLHSLPEDTKWNTFICIMVLYSIFLISSGWVLYMTFITVPLSEVANVVGNAAYALHCIALLYNDIYKHRHGEAGFKLSYLLGYFIDIVSFAHYATIFLPKEDDKIYWIKIVCYYIRLHRPFWFLWGLNNYSLSGNVFGILLKYLYIFTVMRFVFANMFIWLGQVEDVTYMPYPPKFLESKRKRLFYRAFYIIHKLFIPIGPESHPNTDWTRILHVIVMMTGCLLVTGITIASLALVISMYMRPEEIFRSRFRLIMNEMKETNIPTKLYDKVETFYRMYWHKQKAVSVTHLLPIFPPILPATIYTNIYFEGLQKSRILCDLSYQFLSELAKHMETVHYIPGDAIIKRNTFRSSIIYIRHGDVELLSAEDDETPLLRFSRGTILNPCGGCIEVACRRARVTICAATFCTAHVLRANDLWRITAKYGRINSQAYILHSSFHEHLDRVKRHYANREQYEPVAHKSNIRVLKANLIHLKEARDENGKLLLERSDIFLELAGCYIMRNREDLAMIDDADAICLRPTFPCILQPTSSLLTTWNTIVALTIFIVTFAHPYHLFYLKTKSVQFYIFNHMVTLIYITDIIVHLSTATRAEEGVAINFAQTSAQQLKSYWFALDVFSAIPFLFDDLNKLFKLPKMFRALKHFEDICVYQSNLIRFLSYCLLISVACYLVAAVEQAYWCTLFNFCDVVNLTHTPNRNMIALNDGPVETRLKYSLYWSISLITFTTHKTTTLSKLLWPYQLFVMIILEISTIFHILIESMYSANIMVTETMRDQYYTCINTVKDFLVKNDVDPVLRYRFINYLQLCWFTDKAYSITHGKTSIMYDLPPHVSQEIMTMQRSKYILQVPFIKYLNNESLKNVSTNARLFYTSPNEILMNTGDVTNEIYIIKQGTCEVVDPETKEVAFHITSKDHFGDLECLLRLPAYYTVRAVTHVQVFSISKKLIQDAIATPKIKDALAFAKHTPEYQSLQVRRQPFLTYVMPLPPTNREMFPLPRKHEPDKAFLQPFYRLGAFSVLRYVFPRYTIRPDGRYLKRYEWFRGACALMASNLFPLYALLVLQWPWLWYLAVFLDLTAYFDIIQRMLIGYFDEKTGILVYHPSSTAVHYLKGAFLLDMFACLPLEVLDSVRKTIYFENNAYRQPVTCQILMYNRIAQLYRLPNALEFLNEFIDRQDAILLIKAIPLFMSLLVLVTSLIVEMSVRKWLPVNGGWRLQIVYEANHGSWIEHNADAVRYNITETPWNAALTAFYWVVYETTTTGFNLFQPSRLGILDILICAMILGAIITTYFAVRIISIRSNVNQDLAGFQENMTDMVKFMKREKLNKELQNEVVSYYEYTWEKMGGTDYRTVLKLCDQITLRTDAIMHIYGRTFSKCPILKKCESALLRIIGRSVHSMYFRKHMTIIDLNDIVTEMYFVHYGTIEIRESRNDEVITTKLTNGSVFGNLENTKTVLSKNVFIAGSNISLLRINAEVFYKIIQDFSSVKVLMKQLRPYNECYIASAVQPEPIMTPTSISKESVASLTKFVRASKKPPIFFKYLNTNSKFGQIYLALISILCVYLDIYNAGFNSNQTGLIIVLYILDAAFLAKILINYYFPYITEEEALSRIDTIILRKRYLKTEFKFDIVSCVPLELLCLFSTEELLWRQFSFYRLRTIFRMMTVYFCLKRYQEKLSINLTATTITSVFIWFTFFVHTSCCLWYFVGVIHDDYIPGSSWRYKNDGVGVCDNQYICSLYFILTTFTQNGVGDILPRKQAEVVFTCILMILSTLIYMIYVGEFSNIIQYQSFRYFSFYTKYLELQEFLKNNRVSTNLVRITNIYVKHLWRESRGLQSPQFLENAPHCLRLNIMSAAYIHHLQLHPIFRECEPAFLRHLAGCFQPYTYNENMFVVKQCEITNSMYFIHKGSIQEIDEDLDDKVCRVINAGDHFGTANGLNRDKAYDFTYKTILKSQVLTLPLFEWEHLLKHFPRSKDIVYKNMDPDNAAWGEMNTLKQVEVTEEPTLTEQEQNKLIPLTDERSEFVGDAYYKTGDENDQKLKFTPSKLQDTRWPWPERGRHYVSGTNVKNVTGEDKAVGPENVPSGDFVLLQRDDQSLSSKSILIQQNKNVEEIELKQVEDTDKKETGKLQHVTLSTEKPQKMESKRSTGTVEQSAGKLKSKSLLGLLKRSVITFKEDVESKLLPKNSKDSKKSTKEKLKTDYVIAASSVSTVPSSSKASSTAAFASSEYSEPIDLPEESSSERELAYESSLSVTSKRSGSVRTLVKRQRRAEMLQEMQSQSSSNSLVTPSTSKMLAKPLIPKKRRKKKNPNERDSESYSASPYVTANEEPRKSSESISSLDRQSQQKKK